MGTPCNGCGDKDVAKIAMASEEIMERMERLMPKEAKVHGDQQAVKELKGRERELVAAKVVEIKEVKELHEKLAGELRGMLAMVSPDGAVRFDLDTLTFYR
jgi:hypothetical protein